MRLGWLKATVATRLIVGAGVRPAKPPGFLPRKTAAKTNRARAGASQGQSAVPGVGRPAGGAARWRSGSWNKRLLSVGEGLRGLQQSNWVSSGFVVFIGFVFQTGS